MLCRTAINIKLIFYVKNEGKIAVYQKDIWAVSGYQPGIYVLHLPGWDNWVKGLRFPGKRHRRPLFLSILFWPGLAAGGEVRRGTVNRLFHVKHRAERFSASGYWRRAGFLQVQGSSLFLSTGCPGPPATVLVSWRPSGPEASDRKA